MGDTRYCKGLPNGMREGAASILGLNCVTSDGEHYADVQKPSYSYETGKNGYAAHSGKLPRGTVLV